MRPNRHSRPSSTTGSPSTPQDETGDYIRRAQSQHRQYTAEWKKWWDSMSPEEQKKAVELGITEPLTDSSRCSGHAPGEDRDAAESPLSKTGFDFAAVEAPTGASSPAANAGDIGLIIQRVVGMLISSDNAKVSVIALAFAVNLDALNGLGSIREAAAKLKLSPEALSKKKREWERVLDLPPNAFAKSATAKLALSVAQQTKHWKNAKWASKKTATSKKTQ